MHLDRSQRRRLLLGNTLFVLLVLAIAGLLAWLAHSLDYKTDWSQTTRNSVSAKSRRVIGQLTAELDKPIRVDAWIGPGAVRRAGIRDLLARYRRAGADIDIDFMNPDTHPQQARKLGIRSGGELVVHIGDRQQRLQQISEQTLTNALLRLTRKKARWLVFLEGHGERDPNGDGDHDLGRFGKRLRHRGFHVQTLSLAGTPHIPDNTDLLVIASPQSDYLPGEWAAIQQYLRRGGHLLWLTEPGTERHLSALEDSLGIRRRPGVIVDAGARLVSKDSPAFAVVEDYADHPATAGLDQLSLFPHAAALQTRAVNGWHHSPLMHTRRQSWTERGAINGTIEYNADAGETHGPLVPAFTARRGAPQGSQQAKSGGQRVAVVGDGDFLSNTTLDEGVNIDLGLHLVNWLVGDAHHIDIPSNAPPDAQVTLSRTGLIALGFGFLVGLPLALLAVAIGFGFYRRRR